MDEITIAFKDTSSVEGLERFENWRVAYHEAEFFASVNVADGLDMVMFAPAYIATSIEPEAVRMIANALKDSLPERIMRCASE